MKALLESLTSMLIPINDEGDKFALKPSKKRDGFVAKYIDHSVFDMSKLEVILKDIKPSWSITLFASSESFDQTTGQKVMRDETLYFGPKPDKDETDEIVNLFG